MLRVTWNFVIETKEKETKTEKADVVDTFNSQFSVLTFSPFLS
jgi:hypothetical protein